MLRSALCGALTLLVIALLPNRPLQFLAPSLLGLWLLIASLIRYVELRAEQGSEPPRDIPIGFSGSIGRFRVRARGDGRRVEVVGGSQVLAEAIASDDGDELVLHSEDVPDSELGAFGNALGLAIEMAAVADEDRPTERHVAGPAAWRAARHS